MAQRVIQQRDGSHIVRTYDLDGVVVREVPASARDIAQATINGDLRLGYDPQR